MGLNNSNKDASIHLLAKKNRVQTPVNRKEIVIKSTPP